MKDKIFSISTCFFLFVIVAISAMQLQIIEGAKLRSDVKNQIRTSFVSASRGLVYDRQGRPLVQNTSSYALYISPTDIKDEKILRELIGETGFADIDFVIKNYQDQKNYDKVLIDKKFANSAFITKYLSNPAKYKGILLEEQYQRVYPYKDIFAHVLGFTGEVSQKDIELGYRENTIKGKAGLELSYDVLLRGQDGKMALDKNTGKSTIETQPIAGKNLYLTIDLDVQKKLTEIIDSGIRDYKTDAGVGILQNVKTGEILAYVSRPSFDNNLFEGGIGKKDFDKLNNDPKSPMLDRVSSNQYPPGSTFKINTATAALETNSINKNNTFTTGGTFDFGNVVFRDYMSIDRGTVNVVGGLCMSSNIFFMKTSLAMNQKTGGKAIDKIVEYGSMYGLGKDTGIDLPEGFHGYISSPEVKKQIYNNKQPDSLWLPGDLLNASIGQGNTLVTPIQIQTMITSVANGGKVLQPRVLYATNNTSDPATKNLTSPIVRNQLTISKDTLDTIKQGLTCGVRTGIITQLNTPYVSVAAKSGTAEFGPVDPKTGGHIYNHGWVTGYFPAENPEFSFTILLEKSPNSGSAVKLSRDFIDWLYKEKMIDKLK